MGSESSSSEFESVHCLYNERFISLVSPKFGPQYCSNFLSGRGCDICIHHITAFHFEGVQNASLTLSRDTTLAYVIAAGVSVI